MRNLRCMFGWHDWFYDYYSGQGTQRRKCMRCFRWQAFSSTNTRWYWLSRR